MQRFTPQTPIVFDPQQLSQLCVDYLTTEVRFKYGGKTPTAAWFANYLGSLPAGQHGVLVMALLYLRTFYEQLHKGVGKTKSISGLFEETPVELALVMALLRACDVALSRCISWSVQGFRDGVVELACQDPAIVYYLGRVKPALDELWAKNAAMVTSTQASKSRESPPPYTRYPVEDISEPNEDGPERVRGRLKIGKRTEYACIVQELWHADEPSSDVSQRLGRADAIALVGTSTATNKESSNTPLSWDGLSRSSEVVRYLEVLKLEFEAVARSASVGVDVRKFEREVLSRYIR
ncbi:hypothetical protein NMY22_g5559 [Coprinellus aureogranulatus]|nr:hypothetical protein NMY22_g5559 [Coprinellus aureogranulatus]